MKVIGFTGNYGTGADAPRVYLMADSSVLYTGRPFFLHDFARRFVATPTIVVRTGRLGKCVAPKFAHRYWDAFTAGFAVHACDSDDPRLLALDRAFDGALIVGQWQEAGDPMAALRQEVELTVDDQVIARPCLANMDMDLAQMLALVSVRCSIKMGDLLVTGDAAAGIDLAPGQRLAARIAGHQALDVKVRM